jgi:hypothetical protein
MLSEFGTNSVQLGERKNGFLAPKRHQMKHLDFFEFLVGIQAVKLICDFAPKYQQPVGPGNRAQDVGSIPIVSL